MREQTPETDYDRLVETLVRVERENAINCTGPGEVGCKGRSGWHSWSEHRQHVAEAQAAALVAAGLRLPPATTDGGS